MTTIERLINQRRVLIRMGKHQGPGDHKGGTPQSTHGRGGRNASAGTIKSDTESDGGVTIRTMTGERPESGFAVGIKGIKIPKARASEDRIRKFIRDEWSSLSKKGNFLGTWTDDDAGVVWLDVVKVFNGDDYGYAYEAAVKRAQKHGEEAIYDLKNGVEIDMDDEDDIAQHRTRLAA